jgi:hypothetical protein
LPAAWRFLAFVLIAIGTGLLRSLYGADFAVDTAMGAAALIIGAWFYRMAGMDIGTLQDFLGCIVVTCVAFAFIVILSIAGRSMPLHPLYARLVVAVWIPDFCGAYALAYVVLLLT